MCLVQTVMKKNEEYARGLVKLYPSDPHAAEMAQYALDVQKLRHKHEETCPECWQ